MKLGVIDYGAGNLRSVLNTFEAAGVHGHLVRTPEDAEGVTHLVLPGVGAFGDCAEKLRGQGLAPLIREWIEADRPFLGICVGYQVLFESGEEDEGVPGLGLFKGRVVRFPESELKVPHMGWIRRTPSGRAWGKTPISTLCIPTIPFRRTVPWLPLPVPTECVLPPPSGAETW